MARSCAVSAAMAYSLGAASHAPRKPSDSVAPGSSCSAYGFFNVSSAREQPALAKSLAQGSSGERGWSSVPVSLWPRDCHSATDGQQGSSGRQDPELAALGVAAVDWRSAHATTAATRREVAT